jgi:hypothetical protein
VRIGGASFDDVWRSIFRRQWRRSKDAVRPIGLARRLTCGSWGYDIAVSTGTVNRNWTPEFSSGAVAATTQKIAQNRHQR